MREIDQRLLGHALTAIRNDIPSCYWPAFADSIVADRLSREHGLNKPDSDVNKALFAALDDFQSKGVVVPPIRLEPEKIAAVREYLEGQAVFAGRGGAGYYGIDRFQRPLRDVRREAAMAEYTVDQLLRAPYLVDYLNHPAIVDFIQLALGCVPTLYSIRAWWSFAADTPTGLNQQYFHRDTDDWRFVALFLYLTDVDRFSGPHQLVAGSHTLEGTEALIEKARQVDAGEASLDAVETFRNHFGTKFSENCERLFREAIVNVEGPAGTTIMANTVALHRGLAPSNTPRLVVWARYGLGPNANSVDLQRGPLSHSHVVTDLADTRRNRYVNRLLFEFDQDQEAVSAVDLQASPPLLGNQNEGLSEPERQRMRFLHNALDFLRRKR